MNFQPMIDFMDRLTSWRIPGNAVKVCVDNKEVFSYASGYSNLEKKIKMTGDELINIYSCSKVATVTAALQLYEKGYFLLDNPLYDFIPEFKDMYLNNGEKAKNPITLRHLFTMTAGLTYDINTKAFDKARELTNEKMDTLTVIKCLAEEPLSFEPGERWQYSLCHDVLAGVVEVVSGKRFSDYVRENIFLPLDMKESYYHNEKVLDRMAEQYEYKNPDETDIVKLQAMGIGNKEGKCVNKGKSNWLIFGSEYDSGGAGITTSYSDYSKFTSALANSGVGQTGERIIAKGTVELLKTNQLNDTRLKYFNWGHLKGYGYGLGVRTLMDKAMSGSTGSIGEFGWGGAAGATVLVDTDTKVSVFYAHHMLNSHEDYYQPRLRNVLYTCLDS